MVEPLGEVSKTFSLLMEPLRHVDNPGFVATIFRRTSTQVRNPGGLWTESRNLYSQFGATARQALLEWEFPSGATIRFGHMEHADDRHNWQGAQIAMLGFDELAHFSREQFLYMLSRNRSTSGIRPYVRCTLNPVAPDDPVGGWVHEFLQWFIGDDGYAVEERCGVLRYFVNYNDRLYWFGSEAEALEQFPDIRPKTFTFIKSSVFDNQILLQTDPGYLANLQALAPIDKARLLGDGRRGGNWLVREEAGTIFNRSWVHPTPTFKREKGRACLFWDFAATEKQLNKPDPDYTAGVMIQEVEDEMGVKGYTILSCIDFQLGPAGTDDAVIQHTREAAAFCAKNGIKFCVRWEIEPGSAGKRESRRLVSTLAGLDAGGIYSRSDKVIRGKPFTAQAAAGNVNFLMANWNETWLQHMHNFPSGAHDDIWDATSGSFNTLAAGFALRKGTMRRG